MNILSLIEAEQAETHWKATDVETGEILTWEDGAPCPMIEGRTYRTTKFRPEK